MADRERWPSLAYADWRDTCATLQLWTQIVGKIRLARAPYLNHWWQVPLYVSCRGLTTSPIPYEGGRRFAIEFDLAAHRLTIDTSDGAISGFGLEPMAVADFYAKVMRHLGVLGLDIPIWTMPVEIADPIRFEDDRTHIAYDPDYANRFWHVLAQAERVMTEFRGLFGKASPVHFFWGSFDLAVTRFSGRRAPQHPGAPNVSDRVTREAYSHEVSSCGFWPGGAGMAEPVFYSYAYPQPEGFAETKVQPAAAYYSLEMGEFLLPYDAVRTAAEPDRMLLDFLQSTYEAAANAAQWDRAALEREPA